MVNFFHVTLIQRSLARDLAQTFLLCLVSLLTLILIGRGVQLSDLFFGLEIGFLDAISLFVYLTPFFMLIIVPLSCMLSVFLTFLRLSTDREMVALRAGGISLYQLLPAPLLFCLLCALLNTVISLYGLSWGMNEFRTTILDIANKRARIVIQPGVFNQDIFGLTLFARQVDPQTGEMRQVIFEDRTRDRQNRITILAPSGSITTDNATASLVFRLQNGHIYRADGQQFGILDFDEYIVRLDLASLFKNIDLGDVRPKEMSWDDLVRYYRERNGPSERFQAKVDVELHKRWALPLACIVLGIFAVPLASAFEGVRRQMGVVLSLIMFLAYYSVFSLGISIGESGRIPAWISLWVPNLLFLVLGLIGLYLAVHERTPTWRGLLMRLPFYRRKIEATEHREEDAS